MRIAFGSSVAKWRKLATLRQRLTLSFHAIVAHNNCCQPHSVTSYIMVDYVRLPPPLTTHLSPQLMSLTYYPYIYIYHPLSLLLPQSRDLCKWPSSA